MWYNSSNYDNDQASGTSVDSDSDVESDRSGASKPLPPIVIIHKQNSGVTAFMCRTLLRVIVKFMGFFIVMHRLKRVEVCCYT